MSSFGFGMSGRLKQFCTGQFAHIVKFPLRMFTWREYNLGGTKLFLSLRRVDFAVG